MVKHASTLLLLLTLSLNSSVVFAQSEKGKFTDNILHFAQAGDIEHLETLKALPLANDERLALEALTTTQGKRAAELYLKLLTDYPSSAFAALCRQRLAEYQSATKALAHLAPVVSAPELVKPEPAKVETQSISATLPARTPTMRYTLQFGSFSTRASAELRANELKPKVKTKVLEIEDDSGRKSFKVRWAEHLKNRDEARAFGQSLGVEFFVVEESNE
ncbi:MAG: SPOR domain-containing protein [Candidatus Thermochlorobacter sp.]